MITDNELKFGFVLSVGIGWAIWLLALGKVIFPWLISAQSEVLMGIGLFIGSIWLLPLIAGWLAYKVLKRKEV